jgi:hypothetical protein
LSQVKGNHLLKVTIRFGNPFAATVYTVVLLMIGWAIGARWGHTLKAGWMLFFATILLLLHDAAIAILLAIAATRIKPSGRE